jgi:hypothetical protein
MRDGKLTTEGEIEGLKETKAMEFTRKRETEINKEKCKSKIFQYLFSTQGKNEIKISKIKQYVPNGILINLSEHFEDILQELIDDNNLNAKIDGELLILQ